ncbi:uncharacterized protein LTR77_008651 [Saxophila tyrrhenica]|uniref:DUF7587 domain-containing protein n=1 Tax=Saxophila tyrrhenica TaxID=1690608 RepID=A0AAV9NZQ2_9PEZI|nr:hypothetical protein LTR77_008651 [Saxophila tyrrhenica]
MAKPEVTESPLDSIFRPHDFQPGEEYIDLYHVYDNLSRTPFVRRTGIWCADPRPGPVHALEAHRSITPASMRKHLDPLNRHPTQFISFYSEREAALAEVQRRRWEVKVPGPTKPGELEPTMRDRDVTSVRMAHVRLHPGTEVYFFSRAEMLEMMEVHPEVGMEQYVLEHSVPSEWFVWGYVREECVENREDFWGRVSPPLADGVSDLLVTAMRALDVRQHYHATRLNGVYHHVDLDTGVRERTNGIVPFGRLVSGE